MNVRLMSAGKEMKLYSKYHRCKVEYISSWQHRPDVDVITGQSKQIFQLDIFSSNLKIDSEQFLLNSEQLLGRGSFICHLLIK